MLKQKCVLLGVSSSIAIYKAASLCSALKKQGADVHVLMTGKRHQNDEPRDFRTAHREPGVRRYI